MNPPWKAGSWALVCGWDVTSCRLSPLSGGNQHRHVAVERGERRIERGKPPAAVRATWARCDAGVTDSHGFWRPVATPVQPSNGDRRRQLPAQASRRPSRLCGFVVQSYRDVEAVSPPAWTRIA